MGDVVLINGTERQYEWSTLTIGSQPHVCPIHKTIGGLFAEDAYHILAYFGEELLITY